MLDPLIDAKGILRLGGRLANADGNLDEIHPIILPRHSYLAKLLILDAHQRTLHGGVEAVLARIRERFWIPKGRQLIKGIVRKCIVCRKLFGKGIEQPFAPLPKDRMCAARPFAVTGIDFAGPLYVEQGEETKKVYIMLLTCASVRAVHLEVVTDLTSSTCLLALRRFMARRGIPDIIYSDNARTFKKASQELAALAFFVSSEELTDFLARRRIKWRFIVERAPWWGGFWERMVRSVKNCLKLSIGKAKLKFDQMQTLLTEVEDVINQRPLTYIGDDPLDLPPLTPAHFLLRSTPSGSIVDADFINISSKQLRDQWRFSLKQTQLFWKRWRSEYLRQLRSLHCSTKGQKFSANVSPGNVVLVEEQNTPRLLWKMAVVEEAFHGRDGLVRACLLRFANGSRLRRPVQLLYPLEVA